MADDSTQQIQYGGVTHSFPADFTQDDIAKALKTWDAKQQTGGTWEPYPNQPPQINYNQPGPIRAAKAFGQQIMQNAANPYGVSMATGQPVDVNNPPPTPITQDWNPPKSVGEFLTRVTTPWKNEMQQVSNVLTAAQARSRGDLWTAGGQIAGNVVPLLSGAGPQGEAQGVSPSAPVEWGGAYPQGSYTNYRTPQTQAFDLTKAINPPKTEYSSLGRNLAEQTGNVVDFANRAGIPLSGSGTNSNFANAARGAAYETYQYLKNNYVDPVANDQVSVAGSGYQGRTVGEGQRATLGDINARIGQINDLLSDNYIKRRGQQVESATAQDADLKAEHDSLVRILHDEIAARTGVDPADIAALRVRAGKLGSIADQTQAAINDRTQGYQSQLFGQKLPESGTQFGFQLLNRLRGGPEASSSRATANALQNTFIRATPLPTPGMQATSSSPPWLNYLPDDPLARARAMQQAAAEQRARNLAGR